MNAQFILAPPRVLISLEDQITIYEALHWGRVDRLADTDSEDGGDPVQDIWSRNKGNVKSAATSAFGFTPDQLQNTSDALRDVIDSDLYLAMPTRECKAADEIVRNAIRVFAKT